MSNNKIYSITCMLEFLCKHSRFKQAITLSSASWSMRLKRGNKSSRIQQVQACINRVFEKTVNLKFRFDPTV